MRTCTECRSANEDRAHFCSQCGSSLAGPFTRTLGAVDRIVHRTGHFELHFAAGSFAEQRAADVGSALEATAAALTDLLALPGEALGPERARVYLGETLPGPGEDGHVATSGSWVVPEREELWSVYRPDAPGIDLDRAAVRLLVLHATGADLAVAPLLWLGLTGLCAQTAGQAPPAPAVNQALISRLGGDPPSFESLWDAAAAGRVQEASLPALSFLGFLRDRRGGASLRDFIVTTVESGHDSAARSVYGTSMAGLHKAWWKIVRASAASGAGGISRFLIRSLHYLRPYWLQELGIFFLLLIQLAFQQILPRAQALLIDRAILPRNLHFLLGLAIFLFAMVVLVLLTGVVNDFLTTRVSESVLRTLRERMFERLQSASHRFFSRMESGDILSRFTSDLRSVEQGLTGTLTQGAFLILSLVLSVVHILLLNWILGLLVLACLPLFLVTTKFLGPPANRASMAFSRDQAAITSILQEDIAAQPVVKAYNLQALMMQRFRAQAQALYRSAVRLFFLSALFGVSASLLTTAVQVTVLALGGYFVIQGRLPLGNLIEFSALLGLVIGPVQSVSGLLQGMQVATASMDRVEEILDLEPDVRDAADAVELGPLRYGIRFDDVGFSYGGREPQIEGLSLEIAAGESVVFVGPSGSGKSTAINLLMRFYEPDRGRILFDGQDIAHVTLHSLRRQVAAVFQESFLFNTSVRENIRLGREDASDEEVQRAAVQAEVHEAILQMPQGYENPVGERGAGLSGGQRQRLAIARAIIREPSVLVLDEATSALDPRTAGAVSDTLAGLGKGRTTVSVTHRLATAADADRIFVLDRGRLVEQGTHEDLLEAGGLYRSLYEAQGAGMAGGQRALEVAYLQGVPLFADLGPGLLGQVAAFLRPERADAGEPVVCMGDESGKLYLIVAGELDVVVPGAGAEEQVLAVLGPGDYFGEIALLRDVRRTATVRARSASQLLSLDKETLQGVFALVPDLRNRLERGLAVRLAAAVPPARPGAQDASPPRAAGPSMLEVHTGPDPGRLFTLDGAATRLGRDPSNDIVLADRTVSAFHARIQRRPDGELELVDCQSTNGTLLNGQPALDAALLRDGDLIQLGWVTLILHGPTASGDAAPEPRAPFVVGSQEAQREAAP